MKYTHSLILLVLCLNYSSSLPYRKDSEDNWIPDIYRVSENTSEDLNQISEDRNEAQFLSVKSNSIGDDYDDRLNIINIKMKDKTDFQRKLELKKKLRTFYITSSSTTQTPLPNIVYSSPSADKNYDVNNGSHQQSTKSLSPNRSINLDEIYNQTLPTMTIRPLNLEDMLPSVHVNNSTNIITSETMLNEERDIIFDTTVAPTVMASATKNGTINGTEVPSNTTSTTEHTSTKGDSSFLVFDLLALLLMG